MELTRDGTNIFACSLGIKRSPAAADLAAEAGYRATYIQGGIRYLDPRDVENNDLVIPITGFADDRGYKKLVEAKLFELSKDGKHIRETDVMSLICLFNGLLGRHDCDQEFM